MNRPIAEPFHPSPTTRIGPGMNGAIKPEFVAASGNTTFKGFSLIRQVNDDLGMAIMSFSNRPTEQLFDFDTGTSYAAPLVARSASLLWKQLEEQLGEEPQANLVRAVLAASATVPAPTVDLLHDEHGLEGIRRVCGYGIIDDDFAESSSDRRVTLVHQGEIALDTIAVFEVPFPEELREASGKKTMTVSLAFDPPVRRRRAEYIGVKMDYALIRGRSLEEIVEAYRQLSTEEQSELRDAGQRAQGAFKAPFKCDLKPGPQVLQTSTLQRSSWTFSRSKAEYGDSYFLVVRAQRGWAPETFRNQNYAVTLTLEANEPNLYNLIRNRVRLRQQQRARATR